MQEFENTVEGLCLLIAMVLIMSLVIILSSFGLSSQASSVMGCTQSCNEVDSVYLTVKHEHFASLTEEVPFHSLNF